MNDADRYRLERDAVIYAAKKGGAPTDAIARHMGLSLRTVQQVLRLANSGQLAEKLAQCCASQNSSQPYRQAFHRPHRRRNRAPGSAPT